MLTYNMYRYIIRSIKGNPRVHKYKREEERTYGFTEICEKPHSFRCGMDSTKYKNNVYIKR